MKNRYRVLCFCLCICLCFCMQNTAFAAGAFNPQSFFDIKGDEYIDILKLPDELIGDGLAQFRNRISETLEEYNLSTLGPDLEKVFDEAPNLSDSELDALLKDIADAHSIQLNASQLEQLRKLCRGVENLSPDELKEKADKLKEHAEEFRDGLEQKDNEVRDKLEQGKEIIEQGKDKLEQSKDKAGGIFQWLKQITQKISSAFRGLFARH